MSTMRLSKEEIEQIHKIVTVVERHPKTGKVSKARGVSKAATILKKDRKTIYKALNLWPEPPSRMRKGIPSYVEEFEDSESVKEFREKYGGLRNLQAYISAGLAAWKILNKKDPMTWHEDDFLKLWTHPDFKDAVTGKISFKKAVELRKWMVHLKLYDLPKRPEFGTKGLKRPKGARIQHWLKTYEEMRAVIMAIQYPDTLTLFRQGIECGSRISSLKLTKLAHMDTTNLTINMYESKIKKWVLRHFSRATMEFIRRYAFNFNIGRNERLYKGTTKFYNADLKQAGEAAGIGFDLTSHVALKHGFVSQASAHGVPLETVCEQAHTDPQTIRDFYLGIDRSKMRRDLFNEGKIEETYMQWLEKLDPVYQARYNQIKDAYIKVDGLKPKAKAKPKKKAEKKAKRPFSWERIEAITKSEPKTEKGKRLKNYWVEIWELHKKHPVKPYSELREMLKK